MNSPKGAKEVSKCCPDAFNAIRMNLAHRIVISGPIHRLYDRRQRVDDQESYTPATPLYRRGSPGS